MAPVPALLTAARATNHLRIGTTVFDNNLRHPAMLANEAGVERLEEAVHIIKELWTGEPVTFTGRHYSIAGLTNYPRPA